MARLAPLDAATGGLAAGRVGSEIRPRVLTLSTAASGKSEASAIARGYAPGMADAVIAGIARVNDLTVVTRNARHFLPFGIGVSSPDETAGLD